MNQKSRFGRCIGYLRHLVCGAWRLWLEDYPVVPWRLRRDTLLMLARPPLVVFSDLDGTLLDHDTYAWDAAKPALTRLALLGCPVILTSSKTAAEITVLQADMA